MNLFLSYASEQLGLAEEVCRRLQAAGHEVFFDREDLPAGESYDDRIRRGIETADLFVFLVTPESVADGRYTRTELKIAARRWPSPGQHVLPVLAAPTPFEAIPAYLRALNLLKPEGNLAAEVLLEVRAREHLGNAAASPAAETPQPVGPPTRDVAPPLRPAAVADGAEPALRVSSLKLSFARQADGRYRLAMDAEPPPGEPRAPGPSPVTADLAIDAAALEARLWAGAQVPDGPLRRAAAWSPVPGATPATGSTGIDDGHGSRVPERAAGALPAAAATRAVGAQLHALLAGTAVGPALAARLRQVDPQRGTGLRLVVDTTDAPELARLPWELLYDEALEDFIGADRFRPLVRRLAIDAPMPVLAVQPPLRLLVAVAQPTDRPALQVGPELAQLDAALGGLVAEGRLLTRRLSGTTLETLDDALLHWRPHLLHVIGHGDFDGDEGRILLESGPGDGRSRSVSGRQLAVLLRGHLGSLRLVFLNSCLGAVGSAHAAFSGVAQSLLRRGVPAVVAMQFAVPDDQAVRLARHFYRYLAAGQPVDAALASVRAFLFAAGDEVGWAAPVLYLNAPDGRLFDFGDAAPTAPSALPVEPPAPQALPASASGTVDRAARAATHTGWRIGLWIGGGVLALLMVGTWLGVSRPHGQVEQSSQAPVSDPPAAVEPPARPAPPEPEDAGQGRSSSGGGGGGGAQRIGRTPEAKRPASRQPPTAGTRAFGPEGEAWRIQVQPGDSWWALSRRLNGQGSRWPDVQEAHRVQQARRAGTGGAVSPQDADAPLQPGGVVWVPLQRRDGQAGITLQVQRGDTLSSLARRLYGDALAWPRLQQAHRLPDPDRLRPGQVLWVPARD